MQFIPAVDIQDGPAARSPASDPQLFDPVVIAQRYIDEGADFLHIVDLNAALGSPYNNSKVVLQLIETASNAKVKVELSAGLDSIEKIEEYINLPVWQIIVSSKLMFNPLLIEEVGKKYDKSRITISVESNNGYLVSRGYKTISDIHIRDILPSVAALGFKRFISTDITKDSTLNGANIDLALSVKKLTGGDVIVSGGVSSLEEIKTIKGEGLAGVIAGKALLEGLFTTEQAKHICSSFF